MNAPRAPREGGLRRGSDAQRERHNREAQGGEHTNANISPARLVAYDVLRDVDERDAYANLALPSRIYEARLTPRDAALATELAAGTLRGRGRLDRIIEISADRLIDDIDPRTRNVLRLGAHQLLNMRTAAHAAVNESVELQRRVGNQSAAGFVNGVLRAISRVTGDEWNERIAAAAPNSDAALAARTSHPAWVLRALRDALRVEARGEELEGLLHADNVAPKVNLALLPGADIDTQTAETLGKESGLTAKGPSPLGLEIESGDPARVISSLGLDNGWVRVQDQGSQLAALVLARMPLPVADTHERNDRAEHRVDHGVERWLDLCAGPGGKTAVLAAEAALSDATVRANEVSDHRTELVRRSITANDHMVDVVTHDGRDQGAFGGQCALYERILVDAPCSGLGALRRRPEARWRKQPSDLPVLTALQAELLDAAIDHLAPGGVLAYVTCSPHRAETRVIVDAALKRHADVRELDAKMAINMVIESGGRDPLDFAGPALSAQLWPHRHGTDAMFIALLTR